MQQSKYFKYLKERIKEVESIILRDISDTDEIPNYDDAYKIRSYTLLVHAELESYIENTALLILKKHLNYSLNGSGRPKFLIPILTWYFLKSFSNLSDKNQNKYINHFKKSNFSPKCILNEIQKNFNNFIKANNGIKEIDKIFEPLGICVSSNLVSNMDSFGSTRGDFAHNSNSIVICISVNDAKKKVKDILDDLYELDKKIISY